MKELFICGAACSMSEWYGLRVLRNSLRKVLSSLRRITVGIVAGKAEMNSQGRTVWMR